MDTKKLLIACSALLFLPVTGFFYSQKALSFRFIDEEDNFVIGKYLLKGEKIYGDLITNHQPLTYILSAGVQQATHPNSVYLLVLRHRQAVIIWSMLWSLLLIFYFGKRLLIFIVIFELSKIYLLGNLFLAESLVIYPFLFLTGLVLFKEKIGRMELFFWGICLSTTALFLSPVWPVIAASLILMLFKQKDYFLKSVGLILLGAAVPVWLIFKFSDFAGYFYYNLWANLTYTVPAYQHDSWFLTMAKSFLTPILAFLPAPQTPPLWMIRIFVIVLIANLVFSQKIKKAVLLLGFLGLANLRFIPPGTQGYSGFHFLPWYALLIFISCLSLPKNIKNNLGFFNLAAVLIAVYLAFDFAKTPLFTKTNMQLDFYINYSTYISIGDAIKAMKKPNDTLFVSPNSWLIYWQADINHLPKLYGYYTWMAGLPKLHQEILTAFAQNPPTFFYCDDCKGLDLGKSLTKYQEIKKLGGSTRLYVLPERVNSLTKEQKATLDFLKYDF